MKKSTQKRFYVYTVSLGCPKNFVDTEVIAGAMVTKGFGMTPDPDQADIYLLNTCAFIPSARTEAEEYLDEAVSWKKEQPNSRRIVVSGCLNQWDTAGIYAVRYPEVDLWAGINDVAKMGEMLDEMLAQGKKKIQISPPCYLYDENTPRLQLTPQHYAYLKIAEGCDNRCSYCSIPKIRGNLRSRTPDSVVKEAENLLDSGVRELILIGQDITAFGADNGVPGLASLLRRLDNLEGEFLLRLLYTHPAHFNDELIDTLATGKHIVPYLDMPLQHISDPILKAMGRKVTRTQIEKLISDLRRRIPGLGLRTTFITGFPGESEAHFTELRDFIAAQRFERVGVFTYFEEPGTPASTMAEKVPMDVSVERRDNLMQLQSEISLEYNRKLVGTTLPVIIDSPVAAGQYLGRTMIDTPEIDNCVMVTSRRSFAPGEVIDVEITQAEEYDLIGKPAGKRK